MTDGEVTYFLVLGIENQTQQDYAMPVRMMAYDLGEYVCQVDAAAKKHGKGGKAKLKGEFLSGFRSTDKLVPVVTLTIYLGSDSWIAPRSLHEMFAIQNPELLRHIPNYMINLIEPFQMSEADFEKFHTDLNSVLKYLKNAGSKRQLEELMKSDATYESLAWKTATLLNTLTDSKLKFGRRKERVNMCQAIREMREEAEAKGLEQGIERGIERGIEQGIEQGLGIGLSWLADFVKNGVLTLEQASQKAGLSESEFAEKTGLKL